jgi:hypothetical protein
MFLWSTRFTQTIVCWMFLLGVQAQSALAQTSSPNHRGSTIRSWPASPFMTAEQEQKILDALITPNTVLQPGERTLKQIAELMNQVVPTRIDLMALRDTTYTVDEVFTITAEDADTSLASILVRLFGENDLTFNVRNAMVEITSFEAAESQVGQSSRVYDITPLVDRFEKVDIDPNDYYPRSGGFQVINCIQTSVHPDCWGDTVGGPCSIAPYQMGDQFLLVIAAPTLVQLSVQSLLDTLSHANRHGGARTIRGSFSAAQRALAGRQATE